MKHINQNKRDDLYWIVSLKEKLISARDFYKGEELKWLNSIILSCDTFARTIFKGVDEREVKAVLNFANTVRPILYTDKFYAPNTPKDDIVKCNIDDVYDLAEYALGHCKTDCEGDFDNCKLRQAMQRLQVPPLAEHGPCEYFCKEE